LQRPLLREDTFQKKIESALNTKDKTIVSIIQNDWLKGKTKFMMLILMAHENAQSSTTSLSRYMNHKTPKR
jgi:hypothetical protein